MSIPILASSPGLQAKRKVPAIISIVLRATENNADHLSAIQSVGITVREVNQPPILGSLSDYAVEEGAVISFVAKATDSDLPTQSITYSLEPRRSAGAAIDPNTGTFIWEKLRKTACGNQLNFNPSHR